MLQIQDLPTRGKQPGFFVDFSLSNPRFFIETGNMSVSPKTEIKQGALGSFLLPDAETLPVSTDDYEIVRILVISSHRGVTSTISTLYAVRFAQISEWSPLLPAPVSGEVMSILTRRIKCE